MARFIYTLKRETETPINNYHYDNIGMARYDAMAAIRSGRASTVIIERNFKNYMIIWSNGVAAYMKGDYAKENGKEYLLNPNGSIKMSSKVSKKKPTTKKKTVRRK